MSVTSNRNWFADEHKPRGCGLKPSNLSIVTPFLINTRDLGSVPEHLVVYGTLGGLLLILYILLRKYKVGESQENPYGLETRPSLWSMLIGTEDDWIAAKRGKDMLCYIKLERLVGCLAMLIFFISAICVIINSQEGERTRSRPGEERNRFALTTIIAISATSPWQWYGIVISALLPLVFIVAIKWHIQQWEGLQQGQEESRTVMLHNLDPTKITLSTIREQLLEMYPSFCITAIGWALRSAKLRHLSRMLELLNHSEIMLIQTKTWHDEPFKRKQEALWLAKERLRLRIMLEKNSARAEPLPMAFLTFETSRQCNRFLMSESIKFASRFSCGELAPLQKDMVWQNLRHPLTSSLYFLAFNVFQLAFLFFFTTPAALASSLEHLLRPHTESLKVPLLINVITMAAFIFFGIVFGWLVKQSNVRFGGWKKGAVTSKYMFILYSWILFSVVFLPMLALTSGPRIAYFLSETFDSVQGILKSSNTTARVSRTWECVFLPDSGAFFINYLVVSALFLSPLQLHRMADHIAVLWEMLRASRSPYSWAAVREDSYSYFMDRNGRGNMTLAEDYVWLLLHFSILTTFCITAPLVAFAFIVFMCAKHSSTLEKVRVYYWASTHQPAVHEAALKLLVSSSLLPLLINFIFLCMKSMEIKGVSAGLEVSTTLLMAYLCGFAFLQSTDWSWPVLLFPRRKIRESRCQQGDSPYIDPLFNKIF